MCGSTLLGCYSICCGESNGDHEDFIISYHLHYIVMHVMYEMMFTLFTIIK